MMADLVIGGLMGMVAAFVLLGTMAVIAWLVWWLMNKDYKYIMRIRHISGGKAVITQVQAKKVNDPLLGICYYAPSLKKNKRHLLPYLGSEYEIPLTTGKKWYVPFSDYSEEYMPETFDPLSKPEEYQVIEEDKNNKGSFIKVKKVMQTYILRPVNKSIRKWVLDADRAANEENDIRLSWFERNKEFILMVVLMVLTGIICFMVILFSFQYGTHVVDTPAATPQWAIDLLNATLNNTASVPPQFG